MPLSRLAGVRNFCFNSLSPFLSIERILSSQTISFQILLYALFPRISVDTLSTSLTPHIILIIRHSTSSSKFTRFTTVQQSWSNTALINLPLYFKDKSCFPINTPLYYLNFFHALPILALIASNTRP